MKEAILLSKDENGEAKERKVDIWDLLIFLILAGLVVFSVVFADVLTH